MKKLLLSAFAFTLAIGASAQVTDLGGPIAWKKDFKSSVTVPLQQMKKFDLAAVQAEDAINDLDKSIPWRFGYKFETDFTPLNSGVIQEMADGGQLWQLQIESKGALTINLLLDQFELPEGGQLYLYDSQNTNRVGAYTSANNSEAKELGTELVHGDKITVEYYVPAGVKIGNHFRINTVVHGYRSLTHIQDELSKGLHSSGACNIDVKCPLGTPWKNQIRSVAMIVVGGSGICTGALINNTCDDGTPYFLTANHCLGGSTANWAFRFNWESPEPTVSCGTSTLSGNPGTYDQTANGATVLVSGTQADHALLQITNMTMQNAIDWDVYFSGWNVNDTENLVTEVYGIHHPSGDLKKICRALESDGSTTNGIYHATNGGAATWEVNNWEDGVTEPGSSGSPLFDQNGYIIGQLYGGAAACSGTVNNGAYDFYGRLGVSWGLGISGYLNPTACSTTSTQHGGYNPNPATAGLNEINSIDFNLFPNPNNGEFTLQFGNEIIENATITITDISGRRVATLEVDNDNIVDVQLNNLKAGSYFVNVQTASASSTKTFVIK